MQSHSLTRALLLEFKNNQRPAVTLMHKHIKGSANDELQRVASVFCGHEVSKAR